MNELESLIKKAASEASLATALELRDASNINKLIKSAGKLDAAKNFFVNIGKWFGAHPKVGYPTAIAGTAAITAPTTMWLTSGSSDEEKDDAVKKSQEAARQAEAAAKNKKNANGSFWDTVNKYKYTGIGGLLGGSLGLGLSGDSTSSKVISALLGTALGGGAGWALDTYLK